MRTKKFLTQLRTLFVILPAILFVMVSESVGQVEKILYSFDSFGYPEEFGVITGPGGSLYGTAPAGYGYSGSFAFELTPSAGGIWTESTLANIPLKTGFFSSCTLLADASGNLYGTTPAVGSYAGTVFELSPIADGGWSLQTLHTFTTTGGDGYDPEGTLILDSDGKLYGTTYYGGGGGCSDGIGTGCGTVFELAPAGDGIWTERILHSFSIGDQDGQNPFAGVVIDGAGNLYGTTVYGGTGYGAVFELKPGNGSNGVEKILHRFNNNGKDGLMPTAGMVFDAHGNLFGTTSQGGIFQASGGGTAFELTPSSNGGWSEKIIHNFGGGINGIPGYLGGTLLTDTSGNLYGVTLNGGVNNVGAVYELSPSENGNWSEKTLYSFSEENDNGVTPTGGLHSDAAGNLYGTTFAGGANDVGTVFEVTP